MPRKLCCVCSPLCPTDFGRDSHMGKSSLKIDLCISSTCVPDHVVIIAAYNSRYGSTVLIQGPASVYGKRFTTVTAQTIYLGPEEVSLTGLHSRAMHNRHFLDLKRDIYVAFQGNNLASGPTTNYQLRRIFPIHRVMTERVEHRLPLPGPRGSPEPEHHRRLSW